MDHATPTRPPYQLFVGVDIAAVTATVAWMPPGGTLRSGQNYGEFITPPPDAAGDGAGASAERSARVRPAAAG